MLCWSEIYPGFILCVPVVTIMRFLVLNDIGTANQPPLGQGFTGCRFNDLTGATLGLGPTSGKDLSPLLVGIK